MAQIWNIHAEGEGYITYLLLKSLVTDFNLELCLRYTDRPIFPKEGRNIALIPKLEGNLKEIYSHLENVEIYSSNCQGLKNCFPIEGEYILETLKELLKPLATNLVRFLDEFKKEPLNIETQEETLLEKLSFYIPLLIARRESVSYAWKYYLGLKGVPAVSLIYPRDFALLREIIFNPSFGEKIFPLVLGGIFEEVENLLKLEGFVPYTVEVSGKNNLDSELKLIFYAKSIANKLQKLV